MKWYQSLVVVGAIAVVVYLVWKAWKESPPGQAVEKAQEAVAKIYPSATRSLLFPTWSPTWVASPFTIPGQYIGEQLGKLLWGQR